MMLHYSNAIRWCYVIVTSSDTVTKFPNPYYFPGMVSDCTNSGTALPPTEDTLVSTGQAGCCLHTSVAFYSIEGMLVTTTTTT